MRQDANYQIGIEVEGQQAENQLRELTNLLTRLVSQPTATPAEAAALERVNALLNQQRNILERLVQLRQRLDSGTLTPQQRGGNLTQLGKAAMNARFAIGTTNEVLNDLLPVAPGLIRNGNTGNWQVISGPAPAFYGGSRNPQTGAYDPTISAQRAMPPRTPGIIEATPRYTDPSGVVGDFNLLNTGNVANARQNEASRRAQEQADAAQRRRDEQAQKRQAKEDEATQRRRLQAETDASRLHDIAISRQRAGAYTGVLGGLFGRRGDYSSVANDDPEVRDIRRRARANPDLYNNVSQEAHAILNQQRRAAINERNRPGGYRSAAGGFLEGAGLPYAGMGVFGAAFAGTTLVSRTLQSFAELQSQRKLLAGMVTTFNTFRDGQGLPMGQEQNYQTANDYSKFVYQQIRQKAIKSPLTTKELFDTYTTGYPFLASKGLTTTQSLDVVNTIASMGRIAGLRPESVRDDLRAISSGIYKNVQSFQMAGITPDEFRLMTRKSGPEFYKEFKTRFGGFDRSLVDFEDSLQSKMDRFFDTLYQLGQKLGEQFAPPIIDFIEQVNTKVDEWTRDGTLDKMVEKLRWFLDQVVAAGTFFVNNFDKFSAVATGLVGYKAVRTIGAAVGGMRTMGPEGATIAAAFAPWGMNAGQRMASGLAMSSVRGNTPLAAASRLSAGGYAAQGVMMGGVPGILQGLGIGTGASGGVFGVGAGAVGGGALALGAATVGTLAAGAYAGYDFFRGLGQMASGRDAHTYLGDTIGRGVYRLFGGDFYAAGERETEAAFVAQRMGFTYDPETGATRRKSINALSMDALSVLPKLQTDSKYLRQMFDYSMLPGTSLDDATLDKLTKGTDPALAHFATLIRKRGLLTQNIGLGTLSSEDVYAVGASGKAINRASLQDVFAKLGSPSSYGELLQAIEENPGYVKTGQVADAVAELRGLFMDKIQAVLMRDVDSIRTDLTKTAEPVLDDIKNRAITGVSFYRNPDILQDQTGAMRKVFGYESKLSALDTKETYLTEAISSRMSAGDFSGARALMDEQARLVNARYNLQIGLSGAQEELRKRGIATPGGQGAILTTGKGMQSYMDIDSVTGFLKSKGLAYGVSDLLAIENTGARYNVAVDTMLPLVAQNPAFAGGIGPGGNPTLDAIKRFEGFRETAYWDVNAYRTGYGSDTYTTADGTVHRVTANTKITRADAERDLQRRSVAFQSGVISKIGQSKWDSLSPNQQAALTSIAYNYGSLPSSVVSAVMSGGDVAGAIRNLGGHNNGVNRGRRGQEAEMYAGAGGAGGSSAKLEALAQAAGGYQKMYDAYNTEAEARGQSTALLMELEKDPAKKSILFSKNWDKLDGDTMRSLSVIAGMKDTQYGAGAGAKFLNQFLSKARLSGNPKAELDLLLRGDHAKYAPAIEQAMTLRGIRSSLDLSPVQMQAQLTQDYNKTVGDFNAETAAGLDRLRGDQAAKDNFVRARRNIGKARLGSYLAERDRNNSLFLMGEQDSLTGRQLYGGVGTYATIEENRRLANVEIYNSALSRAGFPLDASGVLPSWDELDSRTREMVMRDPVYAAQLKRNNLSFDGQRMGQLRADQQLRRSNAFGMMGVGITRSLANPYLSTEERIALEGQEIGNNRKSAMSAKIAEYKAKGLPDLEAIMRASADLSVGFAQQGAEYDISSARSRRDLANQNAVAALNYQMGGIGLFGAEKTVYGNQSKIAMLNQLFTNPAMLKDSSGLLDTVLGKDQTSALSAMFAFAGEKGVQSEVQKLITALQENTNAIEDQTAAAERRMSASLEASSNFAMNPFGGDMSATGAMGARVQGALQKIDFMTNAEAMSAVPGAANVAMARMTLKQRALDGIMGNRAGYRQKYGFAMGMDALVAGGEAGLQAFSTGGGIQSLFGGFNYTPDLFGGLKMATMGRGAMAAMLGYDNPADMSRREYVDARQQGWGQVGSAVASYGAPHLVNAIYGSQPNFGSEGAQLGGILASAGAFAGLGAWAGPVGILAGALLGGLFKKKSGPSQEDIARKRHQQRLEDLLSKIDKSLRPQSDYFRMLRGDVMYGSASRWMSGRAASSFARQGFVGAY